MEVGREQLVDIILRRRPRLVVIWAPAGYGKSTLVRQLLSRCEGWTVCDCLAVRDEIDCARDVLAAIAVECPALADAIAQAQLGASNDPRDWAALASRFWTAGASGYFVFENAEGLLSSSGALALLERLVRRCERPVIICSRERFPVPYGHGLDPTSVLTFGIEDLRFNTSETHAALSELTPAVQSEIEEISRGWPIVVALLGRSAREKTFVDLVAGLNGVGYDGLFAYLASELVDDLREAERDILFMLAAVPDATYADLVRGWPAITPAQIDDLATRLPLSQSADGSLRLHPIIMQLLRDREPGRIVAIVRAAAQAAQRHGDETRAAELYLSIDDEESAARALRRLGTFIISSPSPRAAAVISRFSEPTLLRFPALWCSALNHRGYSIPPDEWLRSAEAMWSGLPADAEPEIRASVFSSLMIAHTNIGLCARAANLLETSKGALGGREGQALSMLWSAALDAYDGRYDRIAAYTKAVTPLLDASSLTHALYLCEIASVIPLTRGQWDRSAEILHRARELFDRTPLSVALLGVVESAFAGWFSGDDRQCDAHVAELQRRITTANERGHRFFIACAGGASGSRRYAYERTKERVQGLLIASARAGSHETARRFAADAVVMSDRSERRYLRVLARCALALLDDERHDELFTEALALVANLDSAPMKAAVTALFRRRSDGEMLAPFAARYRQLRRHEVSITVRVLRGEVLVDDRAVTLSRSEFAVLIALAQQPRAFSVCELGDLLFPELDGDSASNRVYVYVHRLRQRLGRVAVIGDQRGYQLGATVDVDLWQLDLLAQKARTEGRLTDAEAAQLAIEPLSVAELEALALRLRLPQTLAADLRAARSRKITLGGAQRYQARHVNESSSSEPAPAMVEG